MTAAVDFVIPVLNEEERIAGLLRHLADQFPAAGRIVVDGGSRDRTVACAMPHASRLLIAEPGRAAQMNLGGRVSEADYLVFLHADSVPGITAAALQACLAGAPRWGFCRVRLSGQGVAFRVIEWFMNLRSRVTSVATGDQMLFLQRELFQQTGGFDRIPLMEDVAYCKRLRRLSRPLVIAETVLSSSRRWEQRGLWRTVLSMWALRLAYFLGASPRRLWHFYYGR